MWSYAKACELGDNVTLENGAIVGADGFGFSKNDKGQWEKIPQSGPVRIGDRVDIQANACVDRATVGATEIGDGSKIDNLVQIGHGSRIGTDTLVCAQTGLAGSSVIGSNVILAGQTGIAGHCTVGDGVILTAQSAVSHDVPPGKMISGSPGFDNRIWLRAVTIFQRLPELLKRLDRLEKRVAATTPDSRRFDRKRGVRMKGIAGSGEKLAWRCASLLLAVAPAATPTSRSDAAPTTSKPLSKITPGAPSPCLRLTIPLRASEPIRWPRMQPCIIAFRRAATVRSACSTPEQMENPHRSVARRYTRSRTAASRLCCCPMERPSFIPP